MPRTAIAVGQITRAGLTTAAGSAADVSNGNQCTNTGQTFIAVTNSDTAIHNLTVQPTRLVAGYSVTPPNEPIPASQALPIFFGPYNTRDFGAILEFNGDNAGLHFACYSF